MSDYRKGLVGCDVHLLRRAYPGNTWENMTTPSEHDKPSKPRWASDREQEGRKPKKVSRCQLMRMYKRERLHDGKRATFDDQQPFKYRGLV